MLPHSDHCGNRAYNENKSTVSFKPFMTNKLKKNLIFELVSGIVSVCVGENKCSDNYRKDTH